MNNDLKSNSNVKQAVPFFMVTNVDDSLNFYKGLEFTIKHQWEPRGKIEWCWLELGTASIMLQEYRNNIPIDKRGEGVSVCFMCEDALTIYKQILLNGLSTSSEPIVGNNLWVVSLNDPDGYNVYFESPTDLPEETTYSEWLKTSETN